MLNIINRGVFRDARHPTPDGGLTPALMHVGLL